MIVVTFRNMATGAHSIHPHGVAYGKQSEGECLSTQLQMNLTAVKRAETIYSTVCQYAGVIVGVHDVI